MDTLTWEEYPGICAVVHRDSPREIEWQQTSMFKVKFHAQAWLVWQKKCKAGQFLSLRTNIFLWTTVKEMDKFKLFVGYRDNLAALPWTCWDYDINGSKWVSDITFFIFRWPLYHTEHYYGREIGIHFIFCKIISHWIIQLLLIARRPQISSKTCL